MSSENTNPLLEDDGNDVPGVTITLPTNGLWYDDDVFEEGTDITELEIHPFSMWEEMNHSNPYTIMSGKATTKMINTVAPQIKKPEALCSNDVDVIMLAARMASYGPELKVQFPCSNPNKITKTRTVIKDDKEEKEEYQELCGHKEKLQFNILDAITSYPIIEDKSDWQVKLPSGRIVYFQPSLYVETLEIVKIGARQQQIMNSLFQLSEQKIEIPEEEKERLSQNTIQNEMGIKVILLLSSIHSIEIPNKGITVTDRGQIREWINKASSGDIGIIKSKSEELAEAYNEKKKITYTCTECGHENQEISIIQDPTRFFTANSDG